ncbi:MAG: hypothetical protein R6V84_16745 [Desulfobacterales bacterium]
MPKTSHEGCGRSHPPGRRGRGREHLRIDRVALRGLIVSAVLLAAASCSPWRIAPAPYGDEIKPARALESLQRRLEAADADSVNLLLTDIGRIDYPGFSSVFWRVVYRPFEPGLKRVLIMAGARGNEAGGVECALGVIEALRAAPAPGSLFSADILPVVNAWGWVHDMGRNREKVDIEQDFGSFLSREARIVRRFLRGKRYDLVIDLREDEAAAGFSIRPFAPETTAAAERIVAEIRSRGYPIETRTGGFWHTPRDGVFTAPGWRLALAEWVGELSLPGYARRQVSPAVYAVVAPMALPPSDRVAMLRAALESLIAEHAGAAEPPASSAPHSRGGEP